jgi:molybdopterin-containing oxidoreductase family iron-sulfur binding subunit
MIQDATANPPVEDPTVDEQTLEDLNFSVELEEVRDRLAKTSGPAYWRSLEEAAQTGAFQTYLHNEFPEQASTPATALTRRNFLHVMGASLALAGVTSGCARQPVEKIFPYVKPPEEVIPGRATYYASASTLGGYATGVLVETHMGRPTKIEGLPGHPSSLGAADAITQASVLNMYDPDRSREVLNRGTVGTWESVVDEINGILDSQRPSGGRGVRILTQTITSPTLGAQLKTFLARYPEAEWHQYEPVGRESVREGARLAFNQYADTQYHFDVADTVLALDADFLNAGVGHVRYAKDFAARRDVFEGDTHGEHHEAQSLNRLYAIESAPNLTGAAADHRLAVRPSHVETIARAIASGLGLPGQGTAGADLSESETRWAAAVAADLKDTAGNGVVVVGEHQPAELHALVHAMNGVLANTNSEKTVEYTDSAEVRPENQIASLKSLVDDMAAGDVKMLIMLDGNPLYDAPSDFNFAEAMDTVPMRVYLGLHENETARLSHWHIPAVHDMESWSDARAHDGTISLAQPLIAPLYDGKSSTELLSAMLDDIPKAGYDILREHWEAARPGINFEKFWNTSLSTGMVEGTTLPTKPLRARTQVTPSVAAERGALEAVILPDPSIYDGRFANNGWLQEAPKPLTKLTWDNAVHISPATAQAQGLGLDDLVQVTLGDSTLTEPLPVWIQPGHAADTISLHLGFGRTVVGKVGQGIGQNISSIRKSSEMNLVGNARLEKVPGSYKLARTEEHHLIEIGTISEERGLVRAFTQEEYKADDHVVTGHFHDPTHGEDPDNPVTLYNLEEKKWDGYAWGMTIDLNKCTGCNACLVACQSENNIPVVGREEVRLGREMHWIRVDRYYYGSDLDNPATHFQPVPCMQCENAHCEVVCPVAATTHSREGLNDMTYNRCIGTRYCSNNCAYKVRRFNFYNYGRTPMGQHGDRALGSKNMTKVMGEDTTNAHDNPESIKLMRNPDVTVRTRGVMEKCTYCVQRINLARQDAKRDGVEIPRDGVTTACQQTCPSSAITFGDINDSDSGVSKRKESHRNYATLADLNARPRTTYLARITNPNPELEA